DVAEVNGVVYGTLEAAIAAVPTTGTPADAEITVKLLADLDLKAQIVIDEDVILDLNGKTITNTTDLWVDDADHSKDVWSLISVKTNGNLTITGNGKVLAKANDVYAVDVDGGALVIKNGEFLGNIHSIYVFEGSAEIEGGKFDITQKSSFDDSRYLINGKDANVQNSTATIIVTGGTFKAFNPAESLSENPQANFVASGYQSKGDNDDASKIEWYTVSKIPATNP
ncbi:MAG: hypothetical protein IKL61_00055, partial [Clostridia bacterium]|nr:hypothetical protein [Clostridia bacterium]